MKQNANHRSHYKWLYQMLSLESVAADDRTINTRSGWKLRVYRIKGTPTELRDEKEIVAEWQIRKQWVESLPPAMILRVVAIRKKQHHSIPSLNAGSVIGKEIMRRYYENLDTSFVTEWVAVLCYTAGYEASDKERAAWKEAFSKAESLLSPYALVAIRHHRENHSELLAFWRYLLMGSWQEMTASGSTDIARILAAGEVTLNPKEKTLYTESEGRERHGIILGVRYYPKTTKANGWESLLSLPCEYHLHHCILPQAQEETRWNLQICMGRLTGFKGFHRERLQELEQLGTHLEQQGNRVFTHILTFHLWAESKEAVKENAQEMRRVAMQLGMHILEEGWNLHQSYWGQIPESEAMLLARKIDCTAENVADILSLSEEERGRKSSAPTLFAPIELKTRTQGRYAFAFQSEDLWDANGHTAFIGGTGSGKTTAAMFAIAHALACRKPELPAPRALIFDSGKGLKAPVEALEGRYYGLEGEHPRYAMNPLAVLEDTIENREFLIRWIALLAGNVEEEELPFVTEAIRQNFTLPQETRSLHHLRSCFAAAANARREIYKAPLLSRLSKWLPKEHNPTEYSHPWARFIHGGKEALDVNHPLVAFDMSLALATKEQDAESGLLPPLMSDLVHRFEQSMHENWPPHMIFIDEAARYFSSPLFARHMLTWLRERRKKSGVVCLAFQEAHALTRSQQGRAALENMETLILFPNARAEREEYGAEGLGLNESEREWLREKAGAREILIKRKHGGSAAVSIDLGMLGDALKIFSSHPSREGWGGGEDNNTSHTKKEAWHKK